MDVVVGGKKVRLTKSNYLAEGGEGAIYVRNDTAFKIYTDPKKMIPDGKIQELSALTLPTIIKPEHPIYDSKGTAIGYTMRFVKDTHPLCKVFTRAFKKRHNIKPKSALSLIENMRHTLSHIHQHGILVVDFNEMNFLVDNKFREAYFIDVDSYQTPSYRATALMESVRDRHSTKNHFNQGTDWFAFAVVTFQIMSGVHPYKGKHPKYNGFEDRMMQNLSVFNSEVTVPRAVSDFDTIIPKALKEWYQRTFEETLRCPPPADFANDVVGAQVFIVQTVTGTNNFLVDVLKEFKDDIAHYFYKRGVEVFIVGNTAHFGGMTMTCGNGAAVAFYHGSPVVAWREGNKLIVDRFMSGQSRFEMDATDFMVCNGKIYYKYADYVMEFNYMRTTDTSQMVENVMENATKMFQGVMIQSMLGSFIASYFPETGGSYQVRLKSLSGYRIIDAKMEANVLVVIGSQKGRYDQFIFSVNGDTITTERKIENINYMGINLTVTDKGIAVMIDAEDKVELFSVKNINSVKSIEDNTINANMRLYAKGGKVVFVDGNKLYKLEMR